MCLDACNSYLEAFALLNDGFTNTFLPGTWRCSSLLRLGKGDILGTF